MIAPYTRLVMTILFTHMRVLVLMLFSILIVGFVLNPSAAQADENKKFKRQVLSDCSAAHASFETIPQEAQRELVPYLGRVLDLHLNSVHALPVPITDPNHPVSLPLSDPRVGDLPLLSNPSDEVSAKRCALQLLEKLKYDSFSVLPAVFELLTKATIPASLKHEASILARSIAQAFAQTKATVAEAELAIIDMLIDNLKGETRFAANAALVELGERGLPSLVEHFSNASEQDSEELGAVLESINSLGIAVAPLIYPLLTDSDEPVRIRVLHLLTRLSPPLAEVLPTLVGLLDDISPQVRHECRTTIHQLTKFNTEPRFSLESTTQDALITNYRIAPVSERVEMQPWIPYLLTHIEGLLPRFLTLAQGAQRDLKRDLLESLANSSPLASDSYSVVVKALDDSDIGVRVMAVRALGAFPTLASNASKALLQIFKTLPPAKDLTERTPLLEAAISASMALSSRGDVALIPHLINSLETPLTPEHESDYRTFPRNRESASILSRYRDHPAVKALSTFGESSRAALETTAKKGNSDQARRAIAALGQMPYKESSVLLLAQLLGSPHEATVDEAARALLRLGAVVITQLRRTISNLPIRAKLHVSELMIMLGEKTLADAQNLFKSLDRADCETRAHRILLISDFTPSERTALTPATLACLGQNHEQDHETLSALARLTPLDTSSQDTLIAIVSSPASSSQLKLAILDEAAILSLPPEKLEPEFRKLIERSQGPLQIRAIRSLGKFGHASAELVDILKGMISTSSAEKARSFAIVTTLAKLQEVKFDFKDWFEDSLDTDTYEQVRKSLRAFSTERAEEMLLSIISGSSERKRLLALRLASEILPSKDTLPEKFEALLHSPDPQLMLAAFRVAIVCCPINESVTASIKDLIFSPVNQDLLKVRIPTILRPQLDDLAKLSPYLSERAFARQLIAAMDMQATSAK